MTNDKDPAAVAASLDKRQLAILNKLDRSCTVAPKTFKIGLPAPMIEMLPTHDHGTMGFRLTPYGLGVKFEAVKQGLCDEHVEREIGAAQYPRENKQ